MNWNKDTQLVFAAIFFCVLFLLAFLEFVLRPYFSLLALATCAGASLATYISKAVPAQSTAGYDDAAASAVLFYREQVNLQDKDVAYLRQRTASLEAELESKTREAAELNTLYREHRGVQEKDLVHLRQRTSDLEADLEGKTQEVIDLNKKISSLEADLQAAHARGAASSASENNLPKADKIYRALARKYHPDHNPKMAEVMKDINSLWQTMKVEAR